MTRTSLDDAQWVSLMLVMQQIPRVWKRDGSGHCVERLRRFVVAALWICRTGAPWRDLPEGLGLWSSIYHRWRRWCLRGWWELIFEALRPSLPSDGLLLARQYHLQGTPRRKRRSRRFGDRPGAWPQPWRALL